jgi:hypothetical protein
MDPLPVAAYSEFRLSASRTIVVETRRHYIVYIVLEV